MLTLQSIIVYSLLIIIMSYGAFRSQGDTRRAHLWGWVPIVLFTLVFGLRYGVGVDYNNYLDMYDKTAGYHSFSQIIENERYEYGFSLLLFLCHFLNLPVYMFFTIIAFIQILLLYKTFKNEENVLAYIYITLICTGFCVYQFENILRHEIAFCIFLFSLKYIRDNKLIKYWICCFLALAFHHSALILFPLYFIWIYRKSILNKPFLELCAVIACVIVSSVTQWQDLLHLFDNAITLLGYENYINIADEMLLNNKWGITRIFNLIVNIIIVINSKKIKEYYKSDLFNILYDLFIIGICLGYVFLGSMMFQRIIVYFNHTQFIVLAYTLCYFYETRRQKISQMLTYSLLALFCLISYGSFIYNCKNNTGAYVSYFQESLHPEKDYLRNEMLNKQ